MLAAERQRAGEQLAALGRDFDEIVESSDLTAADDEHDPDGTTIAYERAKAAALLHSTQTNLVELDHADERLADGCYGDCERCGTPIVLERLLARPTARTCINCASGYG